MPAGLATFRAQLSIGAGCGRDGFVLRRRVHLLAFQYVADFFKCRFQVAFRKTYMRQAMNVGELGASFFQQNDRASKP